MFSVNVFKAPGKTMVGERPKPFGEALGPDHSNLRRVRRGAGGPMGKVAEAEALANWVALHQAEISGNRFDFRISERRTK